MAFHVVRLWVRDRCPQKAESLAYTTALALVPLLAVVLAGLKLTGALDAQSALVDFLARQILPDVNREDIITALLEFSSHIDIRTVGLGGLGVTLLVAFLLFHSVERIFNDVWRIDRRRKLISKFLVFYLLFTLVPPAMGWSLYHATVVVERSTLISYLLPASGSFVALVLANKLLPYTRVLVWPALLASLIGTVFLEIAKAGFELYVAKVAFAGYSGVYGRLGLVPVFLLWIYISWLIVLLSAEICHAAQNPNVLQRKDDIQEDLTDQVNGSTAARLLLQVAQHYRSGGKALTRAELCRRTGIGEDVVERIFHRLKSRHLAIEVEGEVLGYLPARPASDILLSDLFAAFRPRGSTQQIRAHPLLEARLASVAEAVQRQTSDVTLADLFDPVPPDPK